MFKKFSGHFQKSLTAFYPNRLFIIPFSILTLKMFFKIINIIGPMNKPSTPIVLKPVYIAIKVNIGWIPIWPLTTLGSTSCLTINIIAKITISAIPRLNSPFNAEIIAHGTITVPEPSIGRASTNPIPSALKNGYGTLKPINFKIYNPIKTIRNEIATNIASAFK